MGAVVKVAEAKAHLSELLARVERGEEFVIARGDTPVARLMPIEEKTRGRAAIETMLALRDSGRIEAITQDEIRTWIGEGVKLREQRRALGALRGLGWEGDLDEMRRGWRFEDHDASERR